MHHLIFSSGDISLRDKIIGELKSCILKTPDALKFDLSLLDGAGLDMNELKAALLTAPAVSAARLVIISRAEKLDEKNLALLDDVLTHRADACVIVLEASGWDMRNALRKNIARKVKVVGQVEDKSVFDLLYDLSRDRAGVLASVQEVFEHDAVENILGAVRWWWSRKVKGTIPAENYKKGLLVIQEADERIKLSGMLVREQVIEVALVKLSLLLKA